MRTKVWLLLLIWSRSFIILLLFQVSSLKCGLLPLCQEALVIGELSQHPFVSSVLEPEEREKIIRNLGPSNKVIVEDGYETCIFRTVLSKKIKKAFQTSSSQIVTHCHYTKSFLLF